MSLASPVRASSSAKRANSRPQNRARVSLSAAKAPHSGPKTGVKAPQNPSKSGAERRLDEFLAALKTQRNASEHTINAYQKDLRKFVIYAGKGLDWRRVDHLTIRGFLSELLGSGLGKASTARALASLRSFYKWMGREGYVGQNPAALVSTPKLPKKLPRVPTLEEVNRVLDAKAPETAAFPERDLLLLELLYGCGIRNSELTGINIEDIRYSESAILI